MKYYSILFVFLLLQACDSNNDLSSSFNQTANFNPYTEKRAVDTVFNELVTTLEDLSARSVCLNPPATDNAILQAEITLGEPLPVDVKAIYRLANGQKANQDCVTIFAVGYQFLPLKDMLSQWQLMKTLAENDKDFSAQDQAQGAVKGYHWTAKWIPLAYMISGDFICIDNDPAESGVSGQIIEFIHDDIPRMHLAINLSSYFGQMLEHIKTEKLVYRSDWGVITSHKN